MKLNKKRSAPLLTIALLIFTFILSLAVGSVNLTLERIFAAFSGADEPARVIICSLRLPRTIGAFLAGSALAVAGSILQTVTGNDLCAPNIVGVNSGAGFFVMLSLCIFPSSWSFLPFFAFVGALSAAFSVIFISRSTNSAENRSTIVLAGVAISSLMNAGISFLSIIFPDSLASYTAFSVGGFSGLKLKELFFPSILILISLVFAYFLSQKISLLSLGNDVASSLGVNVKLIFSLAIVLASALSASAVSFAGLLGFVGLIVPHITRLIFGANLRKNLPYTAAFGAIIATFSDVVGRIIISPGELPAGIIMAFVGAPFFIYLLVRRQK